MLIFPLGPCAWILIAEIWPLSSRSKGIALGASASKSIEDSNKTGKGNLLTRSCTDWMNNFIVGQVTPDMLKNIKYGTYIFFGLITTFGALFIAFMVPETKQLTLGMSAIT